ncbi:MAG: L-aspartate oxidase [Wenzhouxiangellaceae bacterium]|nr:L-aspartate oxidase [Wenzhouxiangellaceae bacterium]
MRSRPVVVVGSGIAGLWAAIKLKPLPVIVLAGASAGGQSSSAWAQGGIAAALGPDDSAEQHAADTIAAGAGLVDAEVAREMTEAAPAQVRALEALGVAFEHDRHGNWVLSREAAHGRARVARVNGDQAGQAIVQGLITAARRASHIEIREGWFGAGLLQDAHGRCNGAIGRDRHGRLHDIDARAVVLATGGLGGLYAVSTNPPGNQGHALAWAWQMGARIQDAEFVQFHPTAIDTGRAPAPLATEALRGEGAILVDRAGRRFMPAVHADAELAPRDIVARAVHRQIQAGAGAFLDTRAAIGNEFPQRFPAVFKACRSAGIDPRAERIPIAPAVHYHMGGIAAKLDGSTCIGGLFAIGEVACTGVHGANRLASNSLLEALVMAEQAGAGITATSQDSTAGNATTAPRSTHRCTSVALPEAAMPALRAAMSKHAGVERDAAGLALLLAEIDRLQHRHGAADALVAARLIAASALQREESRGAHFRLDFPQTRPDAAHTLLQQDPGTTVGRARHLDPQTA